VLPNTSEAKHLKRFRFSSEWSAPLMIPDVSQLTKLTDMVLSTGDFGCSHALDSDWDGDYVLCQDDSDLEDCDGCRLAADSANTVDLHALGVNALTQLRTLAVRGAKVQGLKQLQLPALRQMVISTNEQYPPRTRHIRRIESQNVCVHVNCDCSRHPEREQWKWCSRLHL
jgi:hypothetical protein